MDKEFFENVKNILNSQHSAAGFFKFMNEEVNMKSLLPQNPNTGIAFREENLKEIYIAGGCFWGVQAYYSRILGVKESIRDMPTEQRKTRHMKKYAQALPVMPRQ